MNRSSRVLVISLVTTLILAGSGVIARTMGDPRLYSWQLSITRGSDLVTVSWNRFSDHDKTMLIGSTNNPGTPGLPTADFGKLRTTIHHNYEVTPDQVLYDWRGSDRTATLYAEGTFVNGRSAHNRVDLVAAYNAVHEPDLPTESSWEPTLYTTIHPTQAVPGLVEHQAGPFHAQ